ncbi:hypothetical protein HXX76_006770 [Chlamydomonas incerta]|uniref:BTB domain-containing protein n=1 Tax=Chlamydomonas incerta TaxID=51695 RepID=A0A835W0V8_CHLIN|nr:hypothetical protein HXX76_006770 [Chlamydomonas incerta]|eukprot:KAG2436467.1 hypothetical protein HXX76_006770 [Chlamydomonas incerta]
MSFTEYDSSVEPEDRDEYELDEDFPIAAGCYDAYSGDYYLLEGCSLVRLRSDGSLETVAGVRGTRGRAEGKGPAARFEHAHGIVSDGVGSLYVQDGKRIRRVQLPAAWQRDTTQGDAQGSAAAAAAMATVSTIHTTDHTVPALAYDGTSDSLVYVADAKLFRLPLRRANAAAAGAAAAAPGKATGRGRSSGAGGGKSAAAAAAVVGLDPQLIAGGGSSSSGAAPKDFTAPFSIAVDGDGNIFVLDREDDEDDLDCCIKVIRGGAGAAASASTSAGSGTGSAQQQLPGDAADAEEGGGLFSLFDHVDDEDGVLVNGIEVEDTDVVAPAYMAVLRNGSLVVACASEILALWLGLKPALVRPRVPTPPAAPPRSLAADLGALLGSQPAAASDVTLRVGGRAFAVHRAILAARCDYFRQRLAADAFADGAAAELELPDADADAFALLLRWLYMGAVELPADAGPLQCVAELADRLLLPDLSTDATRKLLAAVTPATVVDALLWAERQGDGGAALLARLKEWYLAHDAEVAAAARDSLKRLAVASPDMMVELHVAARKRPRAA